MFALEKLQYILSEFVEFYSFVCKHNPTIIDFREDLPPQLDETLLVCDDGC